jgi:hypothetical protein
MPATPQERSLNARAASLARWAGEPDWTAATLPARRAFDRRFEIEVDPKGVLPAADRARRAAAARRAYFTRLALKSAQARRRSAELTVEADAHDTDLAAALGEAE